MKDVRSHDGKLDEMSIDGINVGRACAWKHLGPALLAALHAAISWHAGIDLEYVLTSFLTGIAGPSPLL